MSTITHMPTARLGRAVADDATASNHTAAYNIIDRLGGGGPGGQLIVRGFFMGIAFGLLVALLFCCWYPWLHMRHRDRRRAVRRLLLRMDRPRRFRRRRREEHEVATETAQAQTQTEAEEGTATIMTTATGRATTSVAGAAAAP